MLDKLVASKALSSDGAAFVTKALDPFHDFEVNLRGIPDKNTSSIIVQEIKQSITISSPFGAGVEWDMHVYTLPELEAFSGQAGELLTQTMQIQQYGGFAPAGNWQTVNANQKTLIAPIVVAMVQSGGDSVFAGNNSTGVVYYATINISQYFSGQKRLLGSAFEVHDTTAELYKQGGVCVYRMPQANNIIQADDVEADVGICLGIDTISRSPPNNLAACLLLNGSRQWESKEGCYCVQTQDLTRNDLMGTFIGGRKFSWGDDTVSTSAASTFAWGTYSPPFESISGKSNYGWKPTPFHTSGAYFTGLNPNSTFILNSIHILESSPTPDNQQLVVLAKPPPLDDPLALEIYKQASSLLTAGVPVGENASGDFWDGVLGVLGDVCQGIGNIIPVPGAAMLGNLAKKGITAGQNARNKKDEKKATDRKEIDRAGSANAKPNKNAVVVRPDKFKKGG